MRKIPQLWDFLNSPKFHSGGRFHRQTPYPGFSYRFLVPTQQMVHFLRTLGMDTMVATWDVRTECLGMHITLTIPKGIEQAP
jgi:hypothetical protein